MRLVLAGLLLATSVSAGEVATPIVSGTIEVKIQIPVPLDEYSSSTLSVAMVREDTNTVVLCLPAVDGEIVVGETQPLPGIAKGKMLLYGVSFSLPECVGNMSERSVDSYRVVLGRPGRPILMKVK